MDRRSLVAAAALVVGGVLAAPGAALAAEGGEKDKAPQDFVDLLPVGLPVVVDGRLINYVFLTLRIRLSPKADVLKLRMKEPYFRDVLVRLGHRTPFTNPANYTTLDLPRLQQAFAREAATVAGPGVIRAIEIVSETPQKRYGLPKPGANTRPAIQP
jgi:hypothetical protein